VASAGQKPDLQNQRKSLEQFCTARGIAGTEFVEEIGDGLNLKRPEFVAMMDRGPADIASDHRAPGRTWCASASCGSRGSTPSTEPNCWC